jgi:trehalose 6-phosphate phosphatase
MPAPPVPQIPDQVAIFLDFDGTLVSIVARPDLVEIPPGLLESLQTAHACLSGALALVTGRSIADLDRLIEPLRLPTAGVHGLEYRDNSGIMYGGIHVAIPGEVRNRLAALETKDPGLILEDKGASLAMHYRQSPEQENAVRAEFEAIAAELGQEFVLQSGKMVVELRPSGATKGTAVRKFMSASPFAGRQPIFVGDDITDEDAFRVVNEMRGHSIRVGSDSYDTVARFTLPDVSAVQRWLDNMRPRRDI